MQAAPEQDGLNKPAKMQAKTKRQLIEENEDLRLRLEEAEETLQAIRSGEVDALVVTTGDGDQVFTLQGADRSYRALIERMSEGALMLSRQGTILYANRRFADMLHVPLERVIGSNLERWVALDSHGQLLLLFGVAEAEVSRVELDLISDDRMIVPVYLSVSIISVEGWTEALGAVVTDLTERKRAEQEIRALNADLEARVSARTADLETANWFLGKEIEQRKRSEEEIGRLNASLSERARALEGANRELEAFSYSVSHDLRAPLRGIDGFSRILTEEYAAQLPEEAQHYLQVIRTSTHHMDQLINDLLALSRASRQDLASCETDPAAIVNQVIEELRAEQTERQIQFVVGDPKSASPGSLPPCRADPALLRQVYFNLLANAVKFTRQRPVACIEAGAVQMDGKTTYYVRDNGVGFDMKYADKLFGVFQRLHRAEEYEGTGVGLAIVQRIIHRHGGQVWAEAAPDQGATFYFTLA